MIQERIEQTFRDHSKRMLGFGHKPEGKSLETHLESRDLNKEQIDLILINTGQEVASIHEHKTGKMFGPIAKSDNNLSAMLNTLPIFLTRNFNGSYPNWFTFMIGYNAEQNSKLDEAILLEYKTDTKKVALTTEQSEKFEYVIRKRTKIENLFIKHSKLLSEQRPSLNHGNIYTKSVTDSGLTDFSQMRIAPREAEFAYIQAMPKGESIVSGIQKSYESASGITLDEEAKRVMYVFELARKFARRYYLYKNLDKFPDPLDKLVAVIDEIH